MVLACHANKPRQHMLPPLALRMCSAGRGTEGEGVSPPQGVRPNTPLTITSALMQLLSRALKCTHCISAAWLAPTSPSCPCPCPPGCLPTARPPARRPLQEELEEAVGRKKDVSSSAKDVRQAISAEERRHGELAAAGHAMRRLQASLQDKLGRVEQQVRGVGEPPPGGGGGGCVAASALCWRA